MRTPLDHPLALRAASYADDARIFHAAARSGGPPILSAEEDRFWTAVYQTVAEELRHAGDVPGPVSVLHAAIGGLEIAAEHIRDGKGDPLAVIDDVAGDLARLAARRPTELSTRDGDQVISRLTPDADIALDASLCIVLRTPERRVTVGHVKHWRETLAKALTAQHAADDAHTGRSAQ